MKHKCVARGLTVIEGKMQEKGFIKEANFAFATKCSQ